MWTNSCTKAKPSAILITIFVVGSIYGSFRSITRRSETEKLAVDKTAAAANWRRCPLPRIASGPATSTSMAWNYYHALVDENLKTAVRARSFFSYPQSKKHGRGESDDKDTKPRIPHRLIFTHKDNLLDCSNSASNSTPPQLYNLAENVKATLNAYTQIWPDLQFAFLTDDDCIDLINQTEPGLIPYFDGLKGMYKADICRAADLTLHGGYYFDVDILVVQPYVAPADAKFVTVKGSGFPTFGFFQAFFAAEKDSAIARHSLKVMLEALSGERSRGKWLGPTALMEAWMEVENVTNASSVNFDVNNVHLLTEVHLTNPTDVSKYQKVSDSLASINGFKLIQRVPRGYGDDCQYRGGACNHAVLDEADGRIYFYSRVLGTTWCGSLKTDWPCS